MKLPTLADLSRAARSGDAAAVRAILRAQPQLVHERTDSGWGPLFSCAAEKVHDSPARAALLAKAMALMLEIGGDPNSRLPARRSALPLLYFASGFSANLPMTRVLLRHGAKPNDGESLYHSVENRFWKCADLLLRHGGRLNEVHPIYENTPLCWIARSMGPEKLRAHGKEILAWLFRHGADPNVACGKDRSTALHAAAERGWPLRLVRMLLAAGADPKRKDRAGRTPANAARRAGHPRLAALLDGGKNLAE